MGRRGLRGGQKGKELNARGRGRRGLRGKGAEGRGLRWTVSAREISDRAGRVYGGQLENI